MKIPPRSCSNLSRDKNLRFSEREPCLPEPSKAPRVHERPDPVRYKFSPVAVDQPVGGERRRSADQSPPPALRANGFDFRSARSSTPVPITASARYAEAGAPIVSAMTHGQRCEYSFPFEKLSRDLRTKRSGSDDGVGHAHARERSVPSRCAIRLVLPMYGAACGLPPAPDAGPSADLRYARHCTEAMCGPWAARSTRCMLAADLPQFGQ